MEKLTGRDIEFSDFRESGPGSRKLFTVTCTATERGKKWTGIGEGSQKRIAKEMSAREVWKSVKYDEHNSVDSRVPEFGE